MKNIPKSLFPLLVLSSLITLCFYLPQLTAQSSLKEAQFYNKLENKSVQCRLCPRRCVIAEGKRGFCGVRENRAGALYSLSYSKLVSMNDMDPIEKKPLFHFLPGTKTYSIATAGCNLKCKFCQNWEISQKRPEEVDFVYIEPEEFVQVVKESGRPTIAYTYSEPTIFYEYMFEAARLAREKGLRNIMHSNGYINEEPLRQLAKYLDAANIDLKGFSEEYYAKLTEGSLEPVLRSLKILKEEGLHIEITNLILPGFNDDQETIRKMCLWIKENLGEDTPLHFSRFFPMYKLLYINPTPVKTLEDAKKIAEDCGLKFVYIGNIAGHPAENTYCPRCLKIVIERKGYFVVQNNLEDGKCKFCGKEVKGVWK